MTTLSRSDTDLSLAGTLAAEDRALLLSVAREVLAGFLGGREPRRLRTERPALLTSRAAFVTLTRRDTGALRGCRGEMVARRPLIDSVAHMAVAAATDDPRFPPVDLDELPLLTITINALTPLAPIRPEDIVVGRHGLMLVAAGRTGVLLPEVPVHCGWERDRFLGALCDKAGLGPEAWLLPGAELMGFEAEAWSDHPG
jgi:AmmeMemoRadiSam system protein A